MRIDPFFISWFLVISSYSEQKMACLLGQLTDKKKLTIHRTKERQKYFINQRWVTSNCANRSVSTVPVPLARGCSATGAFCNKASRHSCVVLELCRTFPRRLVVRHCHAHTCSCKTLLIQKPVDLLRAWWESATWISTAFGLKSLFGDCC